MLNTTGGLPFYQQFQIGAVVVRIEQVAGVKNRLKLLGTKIPRLRRPPGKRPLSRRCQKPLFDILFQLLYELMGDCKIEFVFAGFGKNGGDGIGGDILELVYI